MTWPPCGCGGSWLYAFPEGYVRGAIGLYGCGGCAGCAGAYGLFATGGTLAVPYELYPWTGGAAGVDLTACC